VYNRSVIMPKRKPPRHRAGHAAPPVRSERRRQPAAAPVTIGASIVTPPKRSPPNALRVLIGIVGAAWLVWKGIPGIPLALGLHDYDYVSMQAVTAFGGVLVLAGALAYYLPLAMSLLWIGSVVCSLFLAYVCTKAHAGELQVSMMALGGCIATTLLGSWLLWRGRPEPEIDEKD
jgi:hypothetical protein